MTNEYSFKKGKTANMPGRWEEKEILITVQCEGQGGKTQVIASQKLDISQFVNVFFSARLSD